MSERSKEYSIKNMFVCRDCGDPSCRGCYLSIRKAFDDGAFESNDRHAKEMEELKNKAIAAFRECCSFYPWIDLCPIHGHDRECDKCKHLLDFTQKLNEQ